MITTDNTPNEALIKALEPYSCLQLQAELERRAHYAPPRPRVLYYGCVAQPGHFWWALEAGVPISAKLSIAQHGGPAAFEKGHLPYPSSFFGRVRFQHEEGVALLLKHVSVQWTLLSFWDRTIDKRSGCASAFAMDGLHSFESAVRIARGAAPGIWARYGFEVRHGETLVDDIPF